MYIRQWRIADIPVPRYASNSRLLSVVFTLHENTWRHFLMLLLHTFVRKQAERFQFRRIGEPEDQFLYARAFVCSEALANRLRGSN